MLLMVEKGIREGICHANHHHAKLNSKYMKSYDKNKESLHVKYWNVNDLYGWAMSQKFPVNNFEWIEETSQYNQDFIKNYNDVSDEEIFLKVDIQYPKKLHKLQNDLPFSSESIQIEKVEKLAAILYDKT